MLNEFVPLVDNDDSNRDKIIADYFWAMEELTFDNFIPLRMEVFVAWLYTSAAWKCFKKHGYHLQSDYGNLLVNIRVNNNKIVLHINDDRKYEFSTICFDRLGKRNIDLQSPPAAFSNMFVNEHTISLHCYFTFIFDSVKLDDNFKILDSKNDMVAFIPGQVKMIKTFLIANDGQRTSKDVCDLNNLIVKSVKECFIEHKESVIYTYNVNIQNSYTMKSRSEDILMCDIECIYRVMTLEEWYVPDNPGYKFTEKSWSKHSLLYANNP